MDECAICLANEINEPDKCTNDCGHAFCKSCIDSWFDQGKNDCPICRHPITYFNHNNDHYRVIVRRQRSPRAGIRVQTLNPQGPNQAEQDTNNRIYINRERLKTYKNYMLFISCLMVLQGYLSYHVRLRNNDLTDNYNQCIHDASELTNLIDTNHLINTNDQDEVYISDKYMDNSVQCSLPQYFIDRCFS